MDITTVCYIVGMIAVVLLTYLVVLKTRNNKSEAMTTAVSTGVVIAVLGIIKLLFL